MRILCSILILLMFNAQIFAKEELFDNPIEFAKDKNCSVDEYCEKYIKDIDIEKFIKNELKNDYVVVSLDECLDVALKNNFDIAINENRYKSSKYEFQNALSKFLPILYTKSYIAEYKGQILVGGVLNDNFKETAISVNLTAQHDLTNGGADVFEAKATKYFQKAQAHNLNFSKSQTIYLTCIGYYELLLAKERIEIYLRNLIERNAQMTLAQKLSDSGLGTKFDVIRSESELEFAKAKLLEALYNFKTKQSNLSNVMGINLNTALMPFENDVKRLELVDKDIYSVEKLMDLALKNREDLKSYKDLINSEVQKRKLILTEFMPHPHVIFQQQFQGTIATKINSNYILGAYLDWAPGENSAFGTITKYKSKKAEIKAMRLELENKLRNIQEALVNNYNASIFASRGIKITKARVDFAKESVKLAMLRFNYGKGILLDVIQAQSEATQARIEYVETIINYNISQIALLYNSGMIEKGIIVDNYKP